MLALEQVLEKAESLAEEGPQVTAIAPNSLAAPIVSPASELGRQQGPSLHIDVQDHIDSSATPEQIEQIFANMAKHLYGRGG